MRTLKDWAVTLPDKYRVVHCLMYLAPDGKLYLAPYGTPDPDPDKPLHRAWREIQMVREEDW